ncbi:MAG: hypothetical protein Q4G35_08315 [Propionibacteriaceae bacterium]|nr:hypothetical protein [Propionibacteriaceae bacterium]
MTDITIDDNRACDDPQSSIPRPETMTWRGPEGWRITLNEDGVILRPSTTALEESDVRKLVKLLTEVLDIKAMESRLVPEQYAPGRVPPPARLAEMSWHEQRADALASAARELRQARGKSGDEVPF